MSAVDEKLGDARIYLATHAPYFLDAVLALIPIETDRVKTFSVSKGLVMFYNPDYVLNLTVKQVATRIWHETNHVLRSSFERDLGDPRLTNISQDLAINSSGLSGPWDFGPDGILPATYGFPNDLTAEEYYELLKSKGGQPNDKGCGSGKCGSIAGNSQDETLEGLAKELKLGKTEIDRQLLQMQVAKNIRDRGRQAGKLPGGWTEWAEALLTPTKIPWSTKLANVYRDSFSKLSSGRDEYSLSRISKRTYAMPDGALRPSLIQYDVDIAIALDTSASMDLETAIRPALREARAVIVQSGCETVWFMQIDAYLGAQPKRIRSRDLAKLEIVGRGGTSFIPAFETAVTLRPRPRLLIYLTDGIGPAPVLPPKGMETIWCLVGDHVAVPAPWGKVIRVES